MKVIIVSDSHGNFGVLQKIVGREEPFDLMVHLGDGLEEAYRIQKLKGFNLDTVSGNNDPRNLGPEYLVLKLGKVVCFFTHGDLYRVNHDLGMLCRASKRVRSRMVFYGHTHCYDDRVVKGVRFLNPGTVCQYLSREPSYIKMEIADNVLKIIRVMVE